MHDSVFIMGPTGVGKTDILNSLNVGSSLFVINVDSVQIYKDLQIGSAKPTPFQISNLDYHLLSKLDLSESYSAANFYKDCAQILDKSNHLSCPPFFVGGTGLYFRVLEQGFSPIPNIPKGVRGMVEEEMNEMGLPWLYDKLKKIDTKLASTVHSHDKQRIIRGLEVFEATGRPLSSFRSADKKVPLVHCPLKIVIYEPDKNQLYKKISRRFDQMIEFGLVNEVKSLLLRNPNVIHSPGLKTIGYLQVVKYLTGVVSFSEMRREAIKESKQLAKRQMTWLKKEKNAIWVESCSINDAIAKIVVVLSNYEVKDMR